MAQAQASESAATAAASSEHARALAAHVEALAGIAHSEAQGLTDARRAAAHAVSWQSQCEAEAEAAARAHGEAEAAAEAERSNLDRVAREAAVADDEASAEQLTVAEVRARLACGLGTG